MVGVDGKNALGEFLRARRERVRPEDVGLSGGGLRRVPGLRREEVALLAGISSDYYLRLEQGRDRNPSVQVLEALARVLRLDTSATAHLVGLAQPERPAASRRRTRRPEAVPASVRELLDTWSAHPSYVQNRFTDCLAANALCRALSPNYTPGVNLLRAVFLDPAEHELRRDWKELTAEGVATLRGHIGPDVDDPRLVELVGELSVRSDRFRLLWSRHEVRPMIGRTSLLSHPLVGDFELRSNKFEIPGTNALSMVVFHAEPGSRSAELLGLLGSLAASDGVPREESPRSHEENAPSTRTGDRRLGAGARIRRSDLPGTQPVRRAVDIRLAGDQVAGEVDEGTVGRIDADTTHEHVGDRGGAGEAGVGRGQGLEQGEGVQQGGGPPGRVGVDAEAGRVDAVPGDGGDQGREIVDGGLIRQDFLMALEQPGHVDMDGSGHASGDPPLALGRRFVVGERGGELVGVRREEPPERFRALLKRPVPSYVGRGRLTHQCLHRRTALLGYLPQVL